MEGDIAQGKESRVEEYNQAVDRASVWRVRHGKYRTIGGETKVGASGSKDLNG